MIQEWKPAYKLGAYVNAEALSLSVVIMDGSLAFPFSLSLSLSFFPPLFPRISLTVELGNSYVWNAHWTGTFIFSFVFFEVDVKICESYLESIAVFVFCFLLLLASIFCGEYTGYVWKDHDGWSIVSWFYFSGFERRSRIGNMGVFIFSQIVEWERNVLPSF